MKKLFLVLGTLFLTEQNQAQEWTEMLQRPGKNFYEIQAAGNAYYKTIDVTKPGTGYKQFKRWEHYLEQRVYPSGDLSLVSTNWKNFREFVNENSFGNKSSSAAVGTWT